MKLNSWQNVWLVVCVAWIAGVAYISLWHYQTLDDRQRYWADAIEGTINGDPMIPRSAKELRSRLGDQKFIAAAQAAYPQVDLRDMMRRYDAEMANRSDFTLLDAVALALIPPSLLYLFGLVLAWIVRRSRSLPQD